MKAWTDLKQTAIINALRCCRLLQGLPLADLRQLAEITVLKRLTVLNPGRLNALLRHNLGEPAFHPSGDAKGWTYTPVS
jgi:hypothetical protein